MTDFPEYSRWGKEGIELFVSDQVFVIFYFEDARHESVYERIVRKLFLAIRPFHVVCLEGKSEVIKKARSARIPGPLHIFIVDKDFDDLLGRVQTVSDLYYLDRYCLENYLLDIDALIETCIEINPQLTRLEADLRTNDKAEFMSTLLERFRTIARLFLVAQKFEIPIENTKLSEQDLLANAPQEYPCPTVQWIKEYREKLLSISNKEVEWLSDAELDGHMADAFPANADQHLTGKHILFCLVRYIYDRLQVDLHSSDPRSFYLRLLNHIQMAGFNSLKSTLDAAYPALSK